MNSLFSLFHEFQDQINDVDLKLIYNCMEIPKLYDFFNELDSEID